MFSSDNSDSYECKNCNYITKRKSQYDRHLITRKHQIRTNTNKIVPNSSKVYQCGCNKMFKHASSLWNHKQKCKGVAPEQPQETVTVSPEPVDSSLVIELLKQNQEFKDLILEERREFQKIITDQNEKMMEICKTLIIK